MRDLLYLFRINNRILLTFQIKSVDKIQLKHMLNQYLEYEMVKDNQALAGLNDEMVSRLFQKVRNVFRNDFRE